MGPNSVCPNSTVATVSTSHGYPIFSRLILIKLRNIKFTILQKYRMYQSKYSHLFNIYIQKWHNDNCMKVITQ